MERLCDGGSGSLAALGLAADLLRGVSAYGVATPRALQTRVAGPGVREGRDVIAQAPAGAGKTVAAALAALQALDVARREPQAVILAPSRELALQVQRLVLALGEYMRVQCRACLGGTAADEDDAALLRGGAHVVVGTPGCVFDMIERGVLRADGVRQLVLDEADEMLSRGFRDQILDIFRRLPKDPQVILLSATMPVELFAMAKNLMREPLRILVEKEELTLVGSKNFFIYLEKEEWKFDTLCDLCSTISIAQTLIFCNSRHTVESLSQKMPESNLVISALHGEMPRSEREAVLREFRSGSCRIIVTTDHLLREIDVTQASFVINYDVPTHRENYAHRIGNRSGRCVRSGVIINFVSKEDRPALQDIVQYYDTDIDEMPMNAADLI